MKLTRQNLLTAAAVVVIVAAAVWFLYFRGPRVPPVYSVATVKSFPHDRRAFTEGLFYRDGALYEGTGEVGTSGVRRTKLETGETTLEQPLAPPYFGEGIVSWKDRLVQLTWQQGTGFVYNLADFSLRDTFTYKGEGWGMTHDGKHIIMSDGTPTLRLLDPETMKQTGTISVTVGGCPLNNINELEWVDGQIYANIWQTSLIARIDPATGEVQSFLDIGALAPKADDPDAVANGIAWDAAGKRLFVTGKYWPELYQIQPAATEDKSAAAAKLASCKR